MTPRDSSHADPRAGSDAAPVPARRLAEFAAGMRLAEVPKSMRERALQLMLDAVGVGLASRRYPFAERTLAGARARPEARMAARGAGWSNQSSNASAP